MSSFDFIIIATLWGILAYGIINEVLAEKRIKKSVKEIEKQQSEAKKYYFVSFYYPGFWAPVSGIIDYHPLEVESHTEKKGVTISSWQEITKDEYEKYHKGSVNRLNFRDKEVII